MVSSDFPATNIHLWLVFIHKLFDYFILLTVKDFAISHQLITKKYLTSKFGALILFHTVKQWFWLMLKVLCFDTIFSV